MSERSKSNFPQCSCHKFIAALLSTLGRRSLFVYVSHLFLVTFAHWLCDREIYSVGAWQMLIVVPPAAGLLWLVAASSERLSAARGRPGAGFVYCRATPNRRGSGRGGRGPNADRVDPLGRIGPAGP